MKCCCFLSLLVGMIIFDLFGSRMVIFLVFSVVKVFSVLFVCDLVCVLKYCFISMNIVIFVVILK